MNASHDCNTFVSKAHREANVFEYFWVFWNYNTIKGNLHTNNDQIINKIFQEKVSENVINHRTLIKLQQQANNQG